MKSRIPVDERALYFHGGEDAGEFTDIQKALEQIGIPVRRLSAACLDEKLGALAGPSPLPEKEADRKPKEPLRCTDL